MLIDSELYISLRPSAEIFELLKNIPKESVLKRILNNKMFFL